MSDIIATLKSTFIEKIGGSIAEWGPKLVMAIITLMIGLWIIRKIMKLIGKAFDKREFDASLKPFLLTLLAFLMKIMLFLAVAGQVGVETTSFIAILGAAGLAIGLALQGSLANFASGVLILIFRPFKVGDLIEAQDQIGFVKEISVFVTVLETFQNKTVIIPNSPLGGGTITNYSAKGNVRSDIPFAIRYGSDVDRAKEIVLEILKSSDKVLQDPAPSVYVTDLNTSNIQLTALPFSTVEDYWDVYWGLRGEIAKKLGEAGYEAPFEQRVVTMKSA